MSPLMIRPSMFVLAGVMFVLPFVTMSCPGGTFTFTGLQLAMGTSVQEQQPLGPPRTRRISAEPLASIALAVVVLGAAVGFASGSAGRTVSAGAAVVGGVLLLALKSKIESELQKQAFGLFQVKFGLGYWGALLSYAGAFIASMVPEDSVYRLPRLGSASEFTGRGDPLHAVAGSGEADTSFCEECGAKLRRAQRYCGNCGTVARVP
jgi:hypothetical protein